MAKKKRGVPEYENPGYDLNFRIASIGNSVVSKTAKNKFANFGRKKYAAGGVAEGDTPVTTGTVAPVNKPTRKISYEAIYGANGAQTSWSPVFEGFSPNDIKSYWEHIPESMHGLPVARGQEWEDLNAGYKKRNTQGYRREPQTSIEGTPRRPVEEIAQIEPVGGEMEELPVPEFDPRDPTARRINPALAQVREAPKPQPVVAPRPVVRTTPVRRNPVTTVAPSPPDYGEGDTRATRSGTMSPLTSVYDYLAGNQISFDRGSLSADQKRALAKAVYSNSGRNKNRLKGGIEYSDYAAGVPPESAERINRLQKGKAGLANPVEAYRVMNDPYFQMATTLGRTSYEIDPKTGAIKISDNYDFTNNRASAKKRLVLKDRSLSEKAYGAFRNFLSDVDESRGLPDNRIQFRLFPSDTVKKRGKYPGGSPGVRNTGNPLLDQLPGQAQWQVGPVASPYPRLQLQPEPMTINPDDVVPRQAIDQPNKQQAAVPKNYKTTARAGTVDDMLNNIQLAATAASFVPVPLISGPARLIDAGIGLYQAKQAIEQAPEHIRQGDYGGLFFDALNISGAMSAPKVLRELDEFSGVGRVASDPRLQISTMGPSARKYTGPHNFENVRAASQAQYDAGLAADRALDQRAIILKEVDDVAQEYGVSQADAAKIVGPHGQRAFHQQTVADEMAKSLNPNPVINPNGVVYRGLDPQVVAETQALDPDKVLFRNIFREDLDRNARSIRRQSGSVLKPGNVGNYSEPGRVDPLWFTHPGTKNFIGKTAGPYVPKTTMDTFNPTILSPKLEKSFQSNLAKHPEALTDRGTFARLYNQRQDMIDRMDSPEGYRRAAERGQTAAQHAEEVKRLKQMQFHEPQPGSPASYDPTANVLRANPYMLNSPELFRPAVEHELGHFGAVVHPDVIDEALKKDLYLGFHPEGSPSLSDLSDSELEQMDLLDLMRNNSEATDYFKDSWAKESTPFLKELQRWGVDKGHMVSANQMVTPEMIRSMHESWKGTKLGSRYPMRMFGIMENVPEEALTKNYGTLAREMNRLSGVAGIGVGLGALGYGMNKQEKSGGGKVKKKRGLPAYPGGGEAKMRKISDSLSRANTPLNWVQRGLYPANNPFLIDDLMTGRVKTHKLATGEDDLGHYVFPTVIQEGNGPLRELDIDEAHRRAIETNTILRVPSRKMADFYSRQGLIRHAGGGYVEGDEMDLSPAEITRLRNLGYDFEEL